MITWAQLDLQDRASPIIEELTFFHDYSIVVIVFTVSGVGAIIGGRLLAGTYTHLGLIDAQGLECVWTLVPGVILLQVAIPSLLLLYTLEGGEGGDRLRLKAVGHQWYWRYEYSDFWAGGEPVEFDSYMLGEDMNPLTRLLDVDCRAVLPCQTRVRVIVGAADVLHSWAVPALGVKADACPGRLNQLKLAAHRPGVFHGQCSEICGANHRFMPIVVEFVSGPSFLHWLVGHKD